MPEVLVNDVRLYYEAIVIGRSYGGETAVELA